MGGCVFGFRHSEDTQLGVHRVWDSASHFLQRHVPQQADGTIQVCYTLCYTVCYTTCLIRDGAGRIFTVYSWTFFRQSIWDRQKHLSVLNCKVKFVSKCLNIQGAMGVVKKKERSWLQKGRCEKEKWSDSVGSFFLARKDSGRMLNHPFRTCAFFSFFLAGTSESLIRSRLSSQNERNCLIDADSHVVFLAVFCI